MLRSSGFFIHHIIGGHIVKRNIIIIFMIFLILFGCSTDKDSINMNNLDNSGVSAETIDKRKAYSNNPQAPDTRSLNNIGQEFSDEDGKVILKGISDYNKTHRIGPIELTLKGIKLVEYIPAMHLIDYFHTFTNNETQFHYVKFHVSIENTSAETVDFAPVSVLKTDKGEVKGFDDDFYLQNLYGVLSPGEKKIGELAFILDKTSPENLNYITLTTSDVFNEHRETVNKGKEIKITF